MPRLSNHREPKGAAAMARHYIRDLVYGASDGIITTFAVAAGATGGSLSHTAILIIGAANLAADGLSMAVGNFASIRANESARAAENLPEEESQPARHAVATFIAFVVAGAIPLAPYLVAGMPATQFLWSCISTLTALFVVGAMRGRVTHGAWWTTGGEMLGLGVFVAAAAYGAGHAVAWAVS
jgi:VIT1/CCC1 family predicted Fe2+/Mn2+ transporter